MGCCQGQVAGAVQAQEHEKTFGPPTSYPSKLHETAQEETGVAAVGSDSAPKSLSERSLIALATVIAEQERRRLAIWRSFPNHETDGEGKADHDSAMQSNWASSFQALQSIPLAEVIPRLSELGVRPWQAIWIQLVADLHIAERRLAAERVFRATSGEGSEVMPDVIKLGESPGSPLATSDDNLLIPELWDDICTLLKQACMHELSLEELFREGAFPRLQGAATARDGHRSEGSSAPSLKNMGEPRALSALRAVLQAKRRMLRLQDQLLWLTRIVMHALASEDLRVLLFDLLRDPAANSAAGTAVAEGASEHGSAADGSSSENAARMWQKAHEGFELQGIFFRVVGDPEDWRILRGEIRCAQHLCGTQGLPVRARLAVALEGLGLRLLAAPLLPATSAAVSEGSGDGSPEFDVKQLHAWIQQVTGQAPEAQQQRLLDWVQRLPNPRHLLTMEPVVAGAASTLLVDAKTLEAHIPPRESLTLALCFSAQRLNYDAPMGEGLTPLRCLNPTAVAAKTHAEVLDLAARALSCSVKELHLHEAEDVTLAGATRMFGCSCQVWYKPMVRSTSVWSWGSDCFVLIFTPGLRDPVLSSLGSPQSSTVFVEVNIDDSPAEERQSPVEPPVDSAGEDPAPAKGPENLRARLQAASDTLWTNRFCRHPRSARAALRKHGLPARFACGLAEPALSSNSLPASSEADGSGAGADGHSRRRLRDSTIDEVVGAELLAAAAKHVMREVSGAMLEVSVSSSTSCLCGSVLARPESGNGKKFSGSTEPGTQAPDDVEKKGGDEEDDDDSMDESPIPPLPTKEDGGSIGPSDSSARTPALHGSSFLESEVWLLLNALEYQEPMRNPTAVMKMKQHIANHLGFLYLAFWVRLAASAVEMWQSHLLSGNVDEGSHFYSTKHLSASFVGVGQRLLRAACRTPPVLVRAISSQLSVHLRPSFLRNLQTPVSSILTTVQMHVPDSVSWGTAASFGRPEVLQSAFVQEAMPLPLNVAVMDALELVTSVSGISAKALSSFRLCTAEDISILRWQPRLAQLVLESPGRPEGARFPAGAVESSLDSPTASTGSLTALLTRRQATRDRAGSELVMVQMPPSRNPAAGNQQEDADKKAITPSAEMFALAMCVSQQVQDGLSASHQVQRSKELLRCSRWLLLTIMQEACEKDGSPVPLKSPIDGAYDDDRGLPQAGVSRAARSCLSRVFRAVQHILQLVVVILGNVNHCPPEVLVTLCTLRGYLWEKRSEVDACYFNYLQALSILDEAWGDPRKQGGRGHPFGLFLSWKLGQISYCRLDVKAIDKFADYFRSLLLQYAGNCPFAWGPPVASGATLSESLDHDEMGKALWGSERHLWQDSCLRDWWLQNDPLNFVAEGPVPRTFEGSSPTPGLTDWPQGSTNADSGLASDMQEVRHGTIFSFGSNQNGQLGVGRPAISPVLEVEKIESPDESCCWTSRDLWWSCRPVRVMALKDCKVKDIACGESHCVAVDSDGQLFAWGSDARGQIGGSRRNPADLSKPAASGVSNGNVVTETSLAFQTPVVVEPAAHLPVRVDPHDISAGLVAFAAVACGAEFSLALDRRGDVWAWGSGEGGVLGLGSGSLEGYSSPKRLESFGGPCSLITCGSYHSMALASEGKLFAWGRAEGGQLGLAAEVVDGHIEEQQLEDTCVCSPLQVKFSQESEAPVVKQVACGDVHSMALDTDGQVWSWGWGEFGQLGLGFSGATYEIGIGGMSSKRMTPEAVQREHFGSMNIKYIACGGAFSGAVGEPGPGQVTRDQAGNLFLWGANEVGQCALPPKKPAEIEVPTMVAALVHTVVHSIACGTAHVVALDVAGKAYSWGASQYGQLGNSTPSRHFVPPPACDKGQAREAGMTRHQPMLIQSLSRIHIMKAACGLHHSLLVTEVEQVGGDGTFLRGTNGLLSMAANAKEAVTATRVDSEDVVKSVPKVAGDTPLGSPRDEPEGEKRRHSSKSHTEFT